MALIYTFKQQILGTDGPKKPLKIKFELSDTRKLNSAVCFKIVSGRTYYVGNNYNSWFVEPFSGDVFHYLKYTKDGVCARKEPSGYEPALIHLPWP